MIRNCLRAKPARRIPDHPGIRTSNRPWADRPPCDAGASRPSIFCRARSSARRRTNRHAQPRRGPSEVRPTAIRWASPPPLACSCKRGSDGYAQYARKRSLGAPALRSSCHPGSASRKPSAPVPSAPLPPSRSPRRSPLPCARSPRTCGLRRPWRSHDRRRSPSSLPRRAGVLHPWTSDHPRASDPDGRLTLDLHPVNRNVRHVFPRKPV